MAITSSQIQELYVAYYGRPADPTGLTYWLSTAAASMAAGQTEEAVLLSISSSFGANAEYTANFVGLNSVGIINKVYMNLFSHQPDPGGLLYWSQKLEAGDLTLGQIVRAVSQSAVNAGNVDGVAFISKVAAAGLFTAALDTTSEILGYSGLAAGNLAKAFIFGINDASTLAAATTALDATVQSVTDAGNAVNGQTFTLTTDVEPIVGTANNDLIKGNEHTLPFDVIDGGNGTDTLRLTITDGLNGSLGETVSNVENIVIQTLANIYNTDISGYTGVQNVTVTGVNYAYVDLTSAAADSVTITTNGGVSLSDETAAAIAVTAGDNADVSAGYATSITVDAGWYASVSANSVDTATVTAGEDAYISAAESSGDITITAGSYASVEIGTFGDADYAENDNGDMYSYDGVATVVSSVGTVTATTGNSADVAVTGSVGAITIDAGGSADVQVGQEGDNAYTNTQDGGNYSSNGLATTVSTVGTVDVSAVYDANIFVTGNAGAIVVDAGDYVSVQVGTYAEQSHAYSDNAGDYAYTEAGMAATVSSAGSVDVTAGDYADIEVTGNAGTINVDAAYGAWVYVGVQGEEAYSYSNSANDYLNQYGAVASVASTVDAINVTTTEAYGEGAYVGVVGHAGAITIDSATYASINVGMEGSQAYTYQNGTYHEERSGLATVASTVASIDVTSAYDTDIDVIGDAGTITVAAGDDVYINVGSDGQAAYSYDNGEGYAYDYAELAAVVSNVESINVTAGNDVSIDITGNAGDITLAVGADVDHNSEVAVTVGGTIDALSITGAEGENWHDQAVDVVAGAITALSLTDVSSAEVSDATDAADAELVRNEGDAENVDVELTDAAATSLNLTVAGVIANLSVWNSAEVTTPAEVEGDPDVVTPVDLETLSLTVNEYALAYTENVVTVVDTVETTTVIEHSFIVDSEINLDSSEVVTLNVAGAGNLLLNVDDASALELIDAQAATGNVTVGLLGTDVITYMGGAGVDTVTVTGALATGVDDPLTTAIEAVPNYTLDGGDGTADELKMSATLAATATLAGAITNFEILNLSAAAAETVDATLFGTDHVVLDGANGFNLNIANAGTVELTAGTSIGGLTVTVEGADAIDAIPADFSLNLDLTGDALVTVANVGALALASNGTANLLDLTAVDATSLTISGAAALALTGSTLTAVTSVAAADFDAGLTIDLSANTVAATVTVGDGSNVIATGTKADTITVGNGFNLIASGAGNDTITVGDGSASTEFAAGLDAEGEVVSALDEIIAVGSVIVGGAGKDTITLGAGAVDTLVYNLATDSNGVNMDVITGFQASFLAGQIERTDEEEVTTLVDVMANDIIDLTGALDAAYAAADLADDTFVNGSILWAFGGYQGEAEGYGAVLTSLQIGEVRFVLDSTTSILYVDANASGTLDNNDLSIKLTGVTALTDDNFFIAV